VGWARGQARAHTVAQLVMAANRCAPELETLAQQAMGGLAALLPYERLRHSGRLSRAFQWLST